MKVFLENFVTGLLVVIIVWLITLDNYFIFGLATPLIFILLIGLQYFLTNKFNWALTIMNFIISLLLTGFMIEYLVARVSSIEFLDEEKFPLANYFVLSAILWIIFKIIVDIVLIIIINTKFLKISMLEKLLKCDTSYKSGQNLIYFNVLFNAS
jgi:hypothetical protein